MNIIVDGPDGSGKSTLVDFLSEKFNLRKKHLVRLEPGETVEEFYEKFVLDIENSDNNIFDRCYFSNIVYSTVFNDSMIVSEKLQEKIFNSVDFVIFCLPTYNKYIKNFDSLRESRFELYSNMAPVYKGFKELSDVLKKSEKYIEYNMFEDRIEDIGNKIC